MTKQRTDYIALFDRLKGELASDTKALEQLRRHQGVSALESETGNAGARKHANDACEKIRDLEDRIEEKRRALAQAEALASEQATESAEASRRWHVSRIAYAHDARINLAKRLDDAIRRVVADVSEFDRLGDAIFEAAKAHVNQDILYSLAPSRGDELAIATLIHRLGMRNVVHPPGQWHSCVVTFMEVELGECERLMARLPQHREQGGEFEAVRDGDVVTVSP